MYYKSIEPYFKKQKHISGYQAIVNKKSESSSESSKGTSSDKIAKENENSPIDQNNKLRLKTKDNWFKEEENTFSKISEEETVTDRNSYGINFDLKRNVNKTQKIDTKGVNIKSIISSFF